jgi:hypothetical protein
MAAIISQLTANKRAREKRIRTAVTIDKSVYQVLILRSTSSLVH